MILKIDKLRQALRATAFEASAIPPAAYPMAVSRALSTRSSFLRELFGAKRNSTQQQMADCAPA